MAHSYAPHDFNHDLYSDILLRSSSGSLGAWVIEDNAFVRTADFGQVASDERIVSTGDLNGDLTSDLVWQNSSTGDVHVWFFNDLAVQSRADIYNPGLDWTAAERMVGYYNNDSYQDILFQHRDEHLHIWNMQGTTIIDNGYVGRPPQEPNYHPKQIGDYDGNGRADVLWQQAGSGTVVIWLLDNKTLLNASVIASPGPTWHAGGTGDFNADGRADVLWHYDDGRTGIWFMNGLTITGTADLGNPGAQWVPVSTGLYNNDDYTDILWRNTQDGNIAIWNMQGGQVIATPVLGTLPLDWTVII